MFRYSRAVIAVALITTACADTPTNVPVGAPQYASVGSFNQKFTFSGLELDGDGQSNDVIQAQVRFTGGGANTTCVFFSDNSAWEIGRYYGATWASQDGAAVLQFCLDHFDDLTPNTTRYNYSTYFEDVQFNGGPVGDIYAHTKASKHAPYTSCTYYSADGATQLGNYGASEGYALKSDLSAWCALHYPDRTQTWTSNPR